MSELLKCPFCGGMPSVAQYRRNEGWEVWHMCTYSYGVTITTGRRKTKQEAIKCWNRRYEGEKHRR